jgi:hypothetical protein
MIKFYYGPETLPLDENNRIIPPPQITIAQNNIYANDTIMGYNYTVSLNGYASNYISTYDEEENPPVNITGGDSSGISIRQILYSINLIKKILSRNGSSLTITSEDDNNIIVAKGGILKSLNFSETDNSWTKYATYTAELEFNELVIFDEDITCSNGVINAHSVSSGLIDINKYKIKEFNDTWTFSIEDDALNFIANSDNQQALNIKNTIINLSYNISATGKNYFIGDNMIPGWMQAKNFVQDRLYEQINNLSSVLSLNGDICSSSLGLNEIHGLDNSGILKQVANNYNIYDETIECLTSESQGSFSLNYSAKLKTNESSSFASDNTVHQITKQITCSNDGSKKNISININGTITGLCAGGLVKSSGNFILPNNGSILIGPSYKSKYTNAANLLESLIDNDDLTESFKDVLDINTTTLSLPSGSQDNCPTPAPIKPASFNLTKNYMEGTITYDVEYTTDRACSLGDELTVSKTTVDVSLPTKIIAEFPIPGGNYLLQDINTESSKKVTISIEGRAAKNCCLGNSGGLGLNTLLTNIITGDVGSIFPSGITIPENEDTILTQKEFNYNPIDGSYNATLAYICSTACEIL